MRYSVQPRDRIFVKDCGFLSFAKQSATDTFKTASKTEIQKQQKQLVI